MNATKRPSAVAGLRRGVSANQEEPASAGSPSPALAEMTPPPRPEKPVRFTLDLDQERHTFLKRFALECGAGVGSAAVMRALIDELREDQRSLPARVRARLRAAER